MLDIKFVRENPDVVRQNIRNKFQDAKLPLVDEVIALDLRNREIKKEVETLRANHKKASKQYGALRAQGKLEEAEKLRAEDAASEERMAALRKDALRATLLEQHGYETQILEFIDMEHTPKNLLIRAVKTGKKSDIASTQDMLAALNIHPTLARLLNEDQKEQQGGRQ